MTWTTILLIIASVLLALLGLVGAIVPGIAGPPFSFLAVLVASCIVGVEHSVSFLVILGVIGAIVFLLDYVVPSWGTKKFGGSKAGVRGSTIGLILGLLITIVFPIGFIVVLVGPFVGAYTGEKMNHTPDNLAWRAAFGSFMGFLAGTFVKTVYAGVCIFFLGKDLVGLI